MTTVQKK